MAPKPPRLWQGHQEGVGPPRAGNPLLPLSATPAPGAFPPSPSARGPALRARARRRTPGSGAVESAAASRRGYGAQAREPEARVARAAHAHPRGPAASVLARAAPFQALSRTSGRLARAAPRPRPVGGGV